MPSDASEARPKRGGALFVVLLLLAAGGWASVEYDVAERLGFSDQEAPQVVAPPPGLELPSAAPADLVAPAVVPGSPDPEKVRAALAPLLRDPKLGRLVVAAVADVRGNLVFTGGTAPARSSAIPASTTKLLTGAAALEALGPDHTFRTSVVRGSARQIVLVGRGDPYLSARPSTDAHAPANLRDLARATAGALTSDGIRRVRLDFDDSWFTGPTTSPDWPDHYVDDGDAGRITALWVNQGFRADGKSVVADPSLVAAEVFATELQRAGIAVAGQPRRTTAAPGATELAGVDSARVDQMVEEVLRISDNEGAEVLAHQVGIAEGLGGSFEGGSAGTLAVLDRLGVRVPASDVLRDGSGLSRNSRLSTSTLLGTLALGADPARPEMRSLIAGLPVAGFTGSLAYRYAEGEPAGRGRVRAKTGTLSGVHGLAGVATAPDGTQVLFVFLANRVAEQNTGHARDKLDELTAALGACACARVV